MAVDHQASERSARSGSNAGFTDRRASETKHSFKTTEFVAYVAAAAGVLIAAAVIGDGDNGGRPFRRTQRLALRHDPDGGLHGEPRPCQGR
jgi:hypothetical protein